MTVSRHGTFGLLIGFGFGLFTGMVLGAGDVANPAAGLQRLGSVFGLVCIAAGCLGLALDTFREARREAATRAAPPPS